MEKPFMNKYSKTKNTRTLTKFTKLFVFLRRGIEKFYRVRNFFEEFLEQNLPCEKSVIKVNKIPNKTNYALRNCSDVIDAQKTERSSELGNKGITDHELKSETFLISTKRKKNFCSVASGKLQHNRLYGYSANEFNFIILSIRTRTECQ